MGRHRDQFLMSVAEALAGLPVHIKNLSLIADQKECVHRVVHESAEARLILAQGFLGTLTFRNVTDDSEIESPASIFQILGADLHRKKPAIFGAKMAFKIQGTLCSERVPVIGPTLLGEIRIDIRHAHAKQFLVCVPQAATALFVYVEEARLLVGEADRLVRVVESKAMERESFLGAPAFRDINHGAYQLNDLSRIIQDRVPRD